MRCGSDLGERGGIRDFVNSAENKPFLGLCSFQDHVVFLVDGKKYLVEDIRIIWEAFFPLLSEVLNAPTLSDVLVCVLNLSNLAFKFFS